MSSEPQKDKLLQSDLFRGIGFTLGVLGVLLLVGAVLHVTAVAGGVWFVWLFITRNIWIAPSVRFFYRRRWTKIFLWPFSRGDQESCASILRAFTWAYLFIGAMLILIEINRAAA